MKANQIQKQVALFVPLSKSGKPLGGAAKVEAVKKFEAELIAQAKAAVPVKKLQKPVPFKVPEGNFTKGQLAAFKAWAVRKANAALKAAEPVKSAKKGPKQAISKKAIVAAQNTLLGQLQAVSQ